MEQSIEWGDLETKSYLIVHSFIMLEETDALLSNFRRGAPPSSYPHGFKLVGRSALESSLRRIGPFLEQVRTHTSLKVDLLNFFMMTR